MQSHVMQKARPDCPHCHQTLSKWATPSFNFSDGLGWGTDYLFVCFNDECNFYVRGWDRMMEKYGQRLSYRYMEYPDSKDSGAIPVASGMSAKGNIMDEEEEWLAQEREAARLAYIELDSCIREQNKKGLLDLLVNEAVYQNVRIRAAEYIGDYFELDMVDPLRNNIFMDKVVAKKTEEAIEKIHSRNYTRECPYCAEIIKARAKICKHCQREL
jgi:hypothetical protein